ncbi:MAG: zinc ribbon domain-containing protein [Pyrinomonadaceae bacterium]
MFCPQCGQQQIPGEVRFCSRCGFPLSGVSEVLARGGTLPIVQQAPSQPVGISPRQRGIRQGGFMMASVVLLVPLVGLLLVGALNLPEELAVLVAVSCVMGGFLRMLYAMMFESSVPPGASAREIPAYVPPPPQQPYAQMNARQQAALPPQQQSGIPAGGWRDYRPDTAELAAPPASVTENTTKLLDERLRDDEAR